MGEFTRKMQKALPELSYLFDNQIIAQYMLDVVYGEHNASKYVWPTVVASTV